MVFRRGYAWIMVTYERNIYDKNALENKLLDSFDEEAWNDDEAIDGVENILKSQNMGAEHVKSNIRLAFNIINGKLVPGSPPQLKSGYLAELQVFMLRDLVRHDFTDERYKSSLCQVEVTDNDGKKGQLAYKSAIFRRDFRNIGRELDNYRKLSLAGVTCIPKIHGVVHMDDDKPCGFLMEYFPRGNLRQNIGDATYEVKMRWALDILDAVIEFEKVGFNHEDLKCENILVDGDGGLKVADFANNGWTEGFKHPGHPEKCVQAFSFGKTVLEIASGENPQSGLVEKKVMEDYPGVMGEIIWKCCGQLETPKAADLKEYLRRKF